MSRLPPLNALKSFEAAARANSFSKAADELHVTQSAVSHQIRQLEEWFGMDLFERRGRHTLPTPEGAELAQTLAEAFAAIATACQRLTRSHDRFSLTIAAIPSIASLWLIPRLPQFLSLHPHINVRLLHAIYGQPIDFEDVDLAIVYGDWADAPPHAEKFLSGASVAVCSALYAEQFGPFTTPSDLLNQTLLHDIDRRPWMRWFKAHGLKLDERKPGPLFEGFNLLHSAMLAGQGVGLAPLSILADDLASGRLIHLFDTQVLEEKAYYICQPSSPRNNARAEVATLRNWHLHSAGIATQALQTVD
jgi:DNA-binding transcriptional LysR family regulator